MIDQAWILDKWCTAFQAGTHTQEYLCEPARPQSMAFSTTVLREYTLLKYVPNVYQAYGGARAPLPQFQWSRKLMPQNHSCEGGPQDLPTTCDGFAFKPISNQFKLIIFLLESVQLYLYFLPYSNSSQRTTAQVTNKTMRAITEAGGDRRIGREGESAVYVPK